MTLNFAGAKWKLRALRVAGVTFAVVAAAAVCASLPAAGQNRNAARSEFASLINSDRVFQVRYPKSLLVCSHRDGENPDVWSPESCTADIPVCDNSGHAGNVLACLAYPADEFRGSELQAAAFSVSRIENLGANECVQKWARSDTSDIHSERIGGLKFQAAKAVETENSHAAEQNIYRIFHKGVCYELDVSISIALNTAFAAEDAPRKLSAAEREKIKGALRQALGGFRFVK